MSYYKVKVNRYKTLVQTYHVYVNTNCPLHAEEMATEILEAQLNGQEHGLECGNPEPIGHDEWVDEDFELNSTSEPV